ncbi:MAG: hypothetical protein LBE36_01695 [Flavobacteriaceae bacterium]|jgi:hypothetical protein|nr:hypothetical protein [Flavobacteriaceae bacterium]
MKIILTLLLSCGICSINVGHCDGYIMDFKYYKGYVFDKSKEVTFINGVSNRFTPSKQEIEHIEKIISVSIPKEKKATTNLGKQCPKISKNLKNYNRQYIGYMDINGNRIVWINFIWKKNCPSNWEKDIILNMDGCSYFWQTKINLEDDKIFDLFINGMA